MPIDDTKALTFLIACANASDKPALISWDEVAQWPKGLLGRFTGLGLLVKDVNTKSLSCVGCEHHCTMDVALMEGLKRAFIVCDHPDMQSQMGRIEVPLERLQQWQASAKQLASLIAALLGVDAKPAYSKETASYKLGMLKGDEGRRWASLYTQPLRLEIAGRFVPVEDLLFFSGAELMIDLERINSLLSSSPVNVGKIYSPSTSKQEARKMATQAMYQSWRDEYKALRLKMPNKPDTWYSRKIAKLSIAQGKQPETIRKHMKT